MLNNYQSDRILKNHYSIGYDIGSSSIKAALYNVITKKPEVIVRHPEIEMEISAPEVGWAEQDPAQWWNNLIICTHKLLAETGVDPHLILSIGISYQMHGLVLVDAKMEVLRPAIIWCDSRAINYGNKAFADMGNEFCLTHMLNSPGNFTASKLKWVKEHEPEVYDKIYKFMLPGDYIHMKMTDQINTTIGGLSEAVLWNFKANRPAFEVMDYYGFDYGMLPDLVDTFCTQGVLTPKSSEMLGLSSATPVTYRAGDQPNNAFSLHVMQPNEIAATGGTSGVVYGVTDKLIYDEASRINSFAHVNHSVDVPRIGSLLCINGAGIQYAWIRQQIASAGLSYDDMEVLASKIPVGSEGLRICPFGNGSERMLGDKNTGAQINNLQFNLHSKNHFYRAGLEGIAFSFVYGCELLKVLGMPISIIKAGNDNLFRSNISSHSIVQLLDCSIYVFDTTGAVGAAKASLIGGGFAGMDEALTNDEIVRVFEPDKNSQQYHDAYQLWKNDLEILIKNR